MGAKIGNNCYINTSAINAFDLVKIGDNVSICTDTHLRGYTIEDGWLKIGSIELEDNAFVGTRCCLAHNSKMSKNSSIEDLTLVPEGTTIPENENWGGSPPTKIGINEKKETIKLRSPKFTLLSLACVFIIPLVTMVAFFPGMLAVSPHQLCIKHLEFRMDNTINRCIICSATNSNYRIIQMGTSWKYKRGTLQS